MAQAFDAETLRVYRSFPLAVMKADFWRYAILYARGGIYADIDVQARRPVASWLPPVDESVSELVFAPYYRRLSWDQCKVVIGLENDAHFCQWVSVGRYWGSMRVGQGSRGMAQGPTSRHAGVCSPDQLCCKTADVCDPKHTCQARSFPAAAPTACRALPDLPIVIHLLASFCTLLLPGCGLSGAAPLSSCSY